MRNQAIRGNLLIPVQYRLTMATSNIVQHSIYRIVYLYIIFCNMCITSDQCVALGISCCMQYTLYSASTNLASYVLRMGICRNLTMVASAEELEESVTISECRGWKGYRGQLGQWGRLNLLLMLGNNLASQILLNVGKYGGRNLTMFLSAPGAPARGLTWI